MNSRFEFSRADLQRLEQLRTGSRVLNQPDLVKVLELTEEQKTQLAGGSRLLLDVLTEKQKAKWKELAGEPFTARMQATLPGFPAGGGFAPHQSSIVGTMSVQLAIAEQTMPAF